MLATKASMKYTKTVKKLIIVTSNCFYRNEEMEMKMDEALDSLRAK